MTQVESGLSPALPKIFQIGFNRCGTRSLHELMVANGIDAVHWKEGAIARTMAANVAAGREPLHAIDGHTAYFDMEWVTPDTVIEARCYFRELATAYPNALFILNMRDVEGWLLSRLRHGKGSYAAAFAGASGIRDKENLFALWRTQWDQHHAAVKTFFQKRPGRLLCFDVEKDDPQIIADFLAPHYRIDASLYPHLHRTKSDNDAELAARRAFGHTE